MLIYRGLIMQRHPKHHVSQHVLVLGEGAVSGHDDFVGNGFAVDLGLLYFRDADPDRLVGDVNFAPLAMLHRGDRGELEQVAARVVGATRERGGDRAGRLLEFSAVLAVIGSASAVVEKIIKETDMTVESVAAFYRDTQFGQTLRAEGREEGRGEGRAELLEALLVERFGEQPDAAVIARRLAGWKDGAAAVHAITVATSLGELQDAEPPG
jgi:hypothetical protein